MDIGSGLLLIVTIMGLLIMVGGFRLVSRVAGWVFAPIRWVIQGVVFLAVLAVLAHFALSYLHTQSLLQALNRGIASARHATTAPSTPAPGSASNADAGYTLQLGEHRYKVIAMGGNAKARTYLFLDEDGHPVQDMDLLKALAMGAWVRENIVASSGTRAQIAQGIPSDMAGTLLGMKVYEAAQDVLAQGVVKALEAYVTGASMSMFVEGLTMGTLTDQLRTSPDTLMMMMAVRGLEESQRKYDQLAGILYPADAKVMDVEKLREIKDLYAEAQVLDVPNEVLASALMPKHGSALVTEALRSMVSAVLPGLEKVDPETTLTLEDLLHFTQRLAEAGKDLPGMSDYYQQLNAQLNLVQANDRLIEDWAENARNAALHSQQTGTSHAGP